eukprot:703921-Pelagomonas_calceolata.AAC.4
METNGLGALRCERDGGRVSMEGVEWKVGQGDEMLEVPRGGGIDRAVQRSALLLLQVLISSMEVPVLGAQEVSWHFLHGKVMEGWEMEGEEKTGLDYK